MLPCILVVDDEPDMCWALQNMLGAVDFGVTTATRGADALELVTHHPYALAFVDAKLPDLDGLELALLIHQRSPQTSVVLISGYYYEEDRAISEGMQAGHFAGFIAKPFDLKEIRAIVQRVMR